MLFLANLILIYIFYFSQIYKLIIESLPKAATLRKLNDLIKRARLAKVNLLTF